MSKQYFAYILASSRYGTLYVGVTSDLIQRVWQHKQALASGFTSKYGVKTLVWYEIHSTMLSAIAREKQIKHWRRCWKINLIQERNSKWADLYPEILGASEFSVIPPGIH